MAYITSKEHFLNYIKKIVREESQQISAELVLPLPLYVDEAYEYADEFCWKIKNEPHTLHENDFWEWLRVKRIQKSNISSEIEMIVTKEFEDTVLGLDNLPGVYSFWNSSEICLYIGCSIDLSSRIISSFKERFRHYRNVVYLKYLVTKTCSDAYVLEQIFIAKEKPVLNKTSKFEDELTLDYHIPELNKPIACNIPGEKEDIQTNYRIFKTRLKESEDNANN